jgi:uncharacterized protein (DUF1499 family)
MTAREFAPCSSRPNCVSSDADPGDAHHVPPYTLAIPAAEAWRLIGEVIGAWPRTRIVVRTDTTLHAECRSRVFRFVDDLELRLRAAERLVAVRSASRLGYSDLGGNRRRVEALRAELKTRGMIR